MTKAKWPQGNKYTIDGDVMRQIYRLDKLMRDAAKGTGKRNYLKHTIDRIMRAGLSTLGYPVPTKGE